MLSFLFKVKIKYHENPHNVSMNSISSINDGDPNSDYQMALMLDMQEREKFATSNDDFLKAQLIQRQEIESAKYRSFVDSKESGQTSLFNLFLFDSI